MKVNANSLRVGNIIEYKSKLWRVAKLQHTQPGKGGAYIQCEMKDINAGTKLNERFRSSEDIEVVRLDAHEYQYLFADEHNLTMMDMETFEQVHINKDLVGESFPLLQDGMLVTVESYNGDPVGARLPDQITLKVEQTEAVVKGQTAASSNKPAILENGIRVMVPPFIEAEDLIIIDSSDLSYIERAK